jgi:hypothetical protein
MRERVRLQVEKYMHRCEEDIFQFFKSPVEAGETLVMGEGDVGEWERQEALPPVRESKG